MIFQANLINRTPSSLLKDKTPFELLHGQPLTISHLRALGCSAYAHNKNTQGDKFAPRSRRCILIGYPSGTKGWKLFDLEQETVFISRDVTFQEDVFPYDDKASTAPMETIPLHIMTASDTEDVIVSLPIQKNTPTALENQPEGVDITETEVTETEDLETTEIEPIETLHRLDITIS